MEFKIEQKTEQPLLDRARVEGILTFESATPSNKDVTKKISESLKTDEKNIAVRNIYTSFGKKTAKVLAYAYKDEKSKLSTEQQPKKKGDGAKEGEEDKPAENKKQ